jgi:2-methylcitrate dehydratase PrpD
MGQHSADVGSNLATNKGEAIGNLLINKGNVRAAKETAYGTAGANALTSVANAYTGNVGGSTGSSMGGNAADYSSPQYSDWLKQQGGGSTSYGVK